MDFCAVLTSSTARCGVGSLKNRKPIGEVGCCESLMVEQRHWWTDMWLRSPLVLSPSFCFPDYLPTNLILPTSLSMSEAIYLSFHLSIYLCIKLSIYLSIYLPIYLCIYLPIYLSIYLSIDRSIDRSIDLSIYRSIALSLYRSIDLSIYLSIYLLSNLI